MNTGFPSKPITCPNCHYVLDETTRDAQLCPACGTDLAPQRAGEFFRFGRDLRRVARTQRQLLWFILALMAIQVSSILVASPAGGALPREAGLVISIIAIGMQIAIVFQLMHLMAALRDHLAMRILVGILMFAPCVNILILIFVNQHATRALKKAGLKVGLLGVRDDDVVRLLGRDRCHMCGYDLTGNVSGRCPECGAATAKLKD